MVKKLLLIAPNLSVNVGIIYDVMNSKLITYLFVQSIFVFFI